MRPFASNESIKSKTPERWREEGRKWMRKRAESIERCDTDGFRTQAAYQDFSYMCDLCARIAENGGYASLTQLYTLDGEPVDARLVETRYGMAWVMDGEDGTKWFNPSAAQAEATRIRNNAKKGTKLGRVGEAAPEEDAERDKQPGIQARRQVPLSRTEVMDQGRGPRGRRDARGRV